MFTKRTFTLSLFALVVSASATASTKLLDNVLANVDRVRECLATGKFKEAQAYAEMTLFARTVTYTTKNDVLGTARRALDIWQDSLGGDVVFVEAPANQADLVIEFKAGRISNGHEFMGLATTRRSVREWFGGEFTYRVTGAIEVATQTPQGQVVNLDVLMNTTLHEIGHYLGLDDSRGKGLVMGPINLQRPVTMPDAVEVDCLQDMRDSATTLLKMAEAEVYVSQSQRS